MMKKTGDYIFGETSILIFGVVLVIVNLFIQPLDNQFSLLFLALTLLIFGLPHGSLDHLVEERSNTQFKFLPFILTYLLQITVVAICWIFLPLISLLFFLLLSAWHFAETDQIVTTTRPLKGKIITLFYGVGILGWILLAHAQQTFYYLHTISPAFTNKLLYGRPLEIVLFFCALLSLSFAGWSSYTFHKFTLLKTALLLLITYYLPLLTAFAFYFGLWHALHALLHIKDHLGINWKALFIKALPFSLVSVFGLILFLMFVNKLHLNLVLLTFIFISALTLPHARVMDSMYQTKKQA